MSSLATIKSVKAIQSLIEDHLQLEVKKSVPEKHALYAPMFYILKLRAKRIRPLLAMLSYQAVSGTSPEKALNLSLAVELFHNFTLVHDDIMDNAPMRRGMPSVHEKWDHNTAILSGDVIFAVAMEFLIRDFGAKAAELMEEFIQVCKEVCEGQMEDMMLAESDEVHIDDYIEMIRKKTAVLIGGAMALGAIAADADHQTIEKYKQYGEWMGIGFQLQDDYLDAFADKEKFGKQVGGDILENKRTFLLLKAFEVANDDQKRELEKVLQNETDPENKVAYVLDVYRKLGIPRYTQEKMTEYFNKAHALGLELEKQEGFKLVSGFLEKLREREF